MPDSPTITCLGCGVHTRQRHPLSRHCRKCNKRKRRPLLRQKWSERYGSRSDWKRKSRRIRAEVGKCELCGSTEKLTVDHIVPRAIGGTSHRSNLRVLCDDCHQAVTREFNKSQAAA